MKKIKKFLKSNIKFILGLVLGLVLSAGGVYAATVLYSSNEVGYDNSTSGLAATDVQGALDELSDKASIINGDRLAISEDGRMICSVGIVCLNFVPEGETEKKLMCITPKIMEDYDDSFENFHCSKNRIVSSFPQGHSLYTEPYDEVQCDYDYQGEDYYEKVFMTYSDRFGLSVYDRLGDNYCDVNNSYVTLRSKGWLCGQSDSWGQSCNYYNY